MLLHRILLADDHALLLDAFSKLLEPDFTVVGKLQNGRSVLHEARKLRPDIILLDMHMPLLNGLEAGRQIKKLMPEIQLVYLTVDEDPELVNEAIQAGASGYLIKNSAASELFHALREVVQGRVYITPLLKQAMEKKFVQGTGKRLMTQKLTSRQREVLQLLGEGHSMKQIGSILHVTPRTVAFHKYRMMEDLRMKSGAELIHLAMQEGLLAK
ncbi:response regulator transcription factor [Candidatus Nitrospira neomarina]|uniref:Response regulator transcription factor n=1 Tax=Candidatus Nitrospira neomarina TaxID=3020899 RepID=A0AA96GJ57_9BACT|nr:response regulator transcription factor [Candidatus Nitrospira neomarina]WNM62287.1 response regulator transcription factor [Candidatus Nitrospira neomarina]